MCLICGLKIQHCKPHCVIFGDSLVLQMLLSADFAVETAAQEMPFMMKPFVEVIDSIFVSLHGLLLSKLRFPFECDLV